MSAASARNDTVRQGVGADATPHRARSVEPLLVQLALAGTTLFFGAPFLWVVAAAFNRGKRSPFPWPRHPTLGNFTSLFHDLDFAVPLRNSLVVASATMALTTLAVALAGYALSRLTFRGKVGLTYAVLLLQTLPLSSTMVPIYDLARRLHLYNTYRGLILAHTAIALPFLVWLMKGFFDAVPRDVEEAAWLDGGSVLRAWRDVVLPSVRPGLALVAGLSFATAWAEVVMVIVLVDDPGKATVPLAFFDQSRATGDYGVVAAMGVLYVLPVLLLFLVTRRWLSPGMAAGAHGH